MDALRNIRDPLSGAGRGRSAEPQSIRLITWSPLSRRVEHSSPAIGIQAELERVDAPQRRSQTAPVSDHSSNGDFPLDRLAMVKPKLTLDVLKAEAATFAAVESAHAEPTLYGVTDGKAVGTYFEHKFRAHLLDRFEFQQGSSAKGIDFPELDVDMKVTSVKQPQSSCPFKSARQKIFGLGYSVLVFVYDKTDDPRTSTGHLNIPHVIFVEKERTADFQTTTGIRKILANHGNQDDLVAFMQERMLPVDEIEARMIADELLKTPPEIGYLTISNALQWRLQYGRVIDSAGTTSGVVRLK